MLVSDTDERGRCYLKRGLEGPAAGRSRQNAGCQRPEQSRRSCAAQLLL